MGRSPAGVLDSRAVRPVLDDAIQVSGYKSSGATVLKGTGRVTGPGSVDVGGQSLTAEHLIVATGSDAVVPPIPGLADVPFWTDREATTLTEIPGGAVMIGGSAVGVELGLFLRRYGAEVTILERSARLLSREDDRVGELTEQYLREEGVDVRTGASAARVRRDGDDTVVDLDGGGEVCCDVVVVGTGRTPRTDGLRRRLRRGAGGGAIGGRARRGGGATVLRVGGAGRVACRPR